MQLIQRLNYIILLIFWLISTLYSLGVIILSIDQISQIKPTLNLNLQLIEFKLQFDSIIVQSELLKTDELVEQALRKKFLLTNIEFERDLILQNFQDTYLNFQKFTSQIYNELSSSPGLKEEQKRDLLMPFEQNLCQMMADEIPFCKVKKRSDFLNDYIDSSFISKFGQPWPQDDNYEYISGGIVNMVHEFVKTITTYFYEELDNNQTEVFTLDQKRIAVINFLNSSSHVQQFLLHFTDQGKLLQEIGYKLLYFNKQMLQSVMDSFKLYVFLTGILIVIILIIVNIIWVNHEKGKLSLIKLSLTNIPYDNLLEAKTVSVLKTLEFI